MFRTIGQLTAQYRVPIIIFWIGLAIATAILAPNLDDVATNDQSIFLPDDAISNQGLEMLQEDFPASASLGAITLVFDAGEGGDVTSDTNIAYMEDVSLWLISEDAPDGISSVDSVILTPEAASALISENQRVAIVNVNIDVDLDTDGQEVLIAEIGDYIADAPDGLSVKRTGQIFTSYQYNETANESVSSTAVVTISLVAVILLLIFRSPISPFIPLFIVTIALIISQGVVALVGDAGLMTIPSTSTVLLIVVIYGAGTDYCLFLVSRFREELSKQGDKFPAAHTTVQRIGESIFNSAATTTTGFVAMAFTQFGLFNSTGPILAIAIVITLTAAMTLTPAIMSVAGRFVFWPLQIKGERPPSRFAITVSNFIQRFPAQIAGVLLTISIALSIYGAGYTVTFDFLSDLPQDIESVSSFRVLEEAIGPGNLQPVNVVVETDNPDLYAASAELAQIVAEVDGVADVRSATQPLGATDLTANITRLDVQFGALSQATAPTDAEPTEAGEALIGNLLAALPAYLEQAATLDPTLTDNAAYTDLLAAIETGDIEGVSNNLGALSQAVAPIHVGLDTVSPDITVFFGGDAVTGLTMSFVNPESNAIRMDLILTDSPYSSEAIDTLEDVRVVLADNSTDYGVTGGTATALDLSLLLASDLRLTIALVLGGIFIILVLMLRSLVAPLYLIGTIALSFGTTLGLTRLVTGPLFGEEDLVFWVPFMIFVFLVALGIDYSIFLFSRIKEEVEKDGDIAMAITRSIASTGAIIASAGAIVSGSFVALTTTSIVGLNQVGFAVGVGILIDTIIIRTVLVPAIALLFGKWSWYPGPLMKQIKTDSRRTGEMVPVGTD